MTSSFSRHIISSSSRGVWSKSVQLFSFSFQKQKHVETISLLFLQVVKRRQPDSDVCEKLTGISWTGRRDWILQKKKKRKKKKKRNILISANGPSIGKIAADKCGCRRPLSLPRTGNSKWPAHWGVCGVRGSILTANKQLNQSEINKVYLYTKSSFCFLLTSLHVHLLSV